jgi:hypothetical protein
VRSLIDIFHGLLVYMGTLAKARSRQRKDNNIKEKYAGVCILGSARKVNYQPIS